MGTRMTTWTDSLILWPERKATGTGRAPSRFIDTLRAMLILCGTRTAFAVLGCAVLSPLPVSGQETPGPSAVGVESNPGRVADDARLVRRGHPHALYVELFGKGGLYTLGYDYAFTDRLAVGAGGSYLPVEGEQVLTLAPYLNVYPAVGPWGSFLVQAGLEIVHIAVPSEVPVFS